MAKQAVAAHPIDLEPIDRLEEKVTRLVTMVAELRTRTGARAGRERTSRPGNRRRYARGWPTPMPAACELLALRDEREIIRSRVSEMLQQLEAL